MMNEQWYLSDKDTATVERRRNQRPRSNQQRPTNKVVDTTQQSVDDETDVKQVDKTTENKRRQSATMK